MGEEQSAPAGAVKAMMKAVLAMVLLALAPAAAALEPDDVTPLFRDEAPMAVTITGPIRRIAFRAPYATDAHPASLSVNGETHAIELSARGISRRERTKCQFPPLRVRLVDKPDAASPFHRQRGLKLVTHCNEAEAFEQIVLREYAAYRLYNLLTPASFRVRLLRVTYKDAGKTLATKWGFFIEDVDDAARRLGKRELSITTNDRRTLDRPALARFSLFQYMIGNTDWDVTAGPPGSDCCHNVKLLAQDRDVLANIIPLPYDFDNAGLVGAPYAVPSELLPIRDVRERLYRGFCAVNPLLAGEAEIFMRSRPDMEAMLATIPGLSEPSRRAMLRYLEPFFTDIGSAARLQRRLAAKCI